jgi:Fe-S oxidoreductase
VIEQCVNCGSCFAECPSNVNIPKMTLEAKAQYVKRYGPSFEDRLVVNAELAGRTARKFPGALQKMMNLAPVKYVGQHITGISSQREFPAFEARSLFERIRFQEGRGEPRVLYFAGCYAAYLKPQIGEAAVSVMKSMGMTVLTPPQHCCGLPMLSKGMVDAARAKIRRNVAKWQDLLDEIDYIAVTCSSCGFSLLEEWRSIFEEKAVSIIKSKTIHISRLLNRHFDRLKLKPLDLQIAYHMPCHLKIQSDPDSSIQLLSSIEGISVKDLKSHCCGMAGSWGMAAEHYDLSKKIGSDMIAKLNAFPSAIGVTDCPTCRMQMEHFSDKQIKHPVEVIAELVALL